VQNLSVAAPAAGQGGLDTTLAIPLPDGGLAPGASVSFALSFAVFRHGPYWYGYDIDAITAPDFELSHQGQARRAAAPPSQLRYATESGILP
jgi:hypothetical protein